MTCPEPFPDDILREIREYPGNDRCCDCSSLDTDWGSISHGTLICLECAGKHRSLGVHVSFVRSISMDSWSPYQIEMMRQGGNEQIRRFFRKLEIDHLPVQQLYHSKVAKHYRDRLKERVQKIICGEIQPQKRVFHKTKRASKPHTSMTDMISGTYTYEVTFGPTSMGMTITKDSMHRAVVSRLVPGGSAQIGGVEIGDHIIGIARRHLEHYDEIMHMIPCMPRPVLIQFARNRYRGTELGHAISLPNSPFIADLGSTSRGLLQSNSMHNLNLQAPISQLGLDAVQKNVAKLNMDSMKSKVSNRLRSRSGGSFDDIFIEESYPGEPERSPRNSAKLVKTRSKSKDSVESDGSKTFMLADNDCTVPPVMSNIRDDVPTFALPSESIPHLDRSTSHIEQPYQARNLDDPENDDCTPTIVSEINSTSPELGQRRFSLISGEKLAHRVVLETGTPIKVRDEDRWRTAVLRRMHRDGTFKVMFRDGSTEAYVSIDRIAMTIEAVRALSRRASSFASKSSGDSAHHSPRLEEDDWPTGKSSCDGQQQQARTGSYREDNVAIEDPIEISNSFSMRPEDFAVSLNDSELSQWIESELDLNSVHRHESACCDDTHLNVHICTDQHNTVVDKHNASTFTVEYSQGPLGLRLSAHNNFTDKIEEISGSYGLNSLVGATTGTTCDIPIVTFVVPNGNSELNGVIIGDELVGIGSMEIQDYHHALLVLQSHSFPLQLTFRRVI